jgi:hypothetical protein
MKKIWYVSIHNTQEGPYSVEDLKRDDRITPDTLVWKEGFPRWIPIRDVPELKKIFKDEKKNENDDDLDEKQPSRICFDEVVLDYQQDPNSIFWLIVVTLALIYSLYQFYVFT